MFSQTGFFSGSSSMDVVNTKINDFFWLRTMKDQEKREQMKKKEMNNNNTNSNNKWITNAYAMMFEHRR